MIRNIAGGVAGLLAAGIVIMAVQFLGMVSFPLPPELSAIFESRDFARMKAAMPNMPLVNMLMVLLAYILGSTAGGFVATAIATSRMWPPAFVVGILLTIAGLGNLAIIPHPLWFQIESLVCYIPCALLGANLATMVLPAQPLDSEDSFQA